MLFGTHAGNINRIGSRLVGLAVFALVLALLSTAPPAASEPPAERVRYPRQPATPRVREDALERRLEQAQRAQPCAAEDLFRELRLSFRVCRTCIDDETLAEQIEFLGRLIETTAEDDVDYPDYPDYLFRLADLYLEDKARHEREAASLQARIDEQACVTAQLR